MRPYGYAQDRTTVVAEEARALAEAAERIAGGESLRATTGWLNAQGYRTSAGGRWSSNTLRRLLLSPRSAGLSPLPDGTLAAAPWKPLLDRDTWEKLRLLFADETRRSAPQSATRTYLLSGGIAMCGRCGMQLYPRPSDAGSRTYYCRPGPPTPGCARIRIHAESLEQHVAVHVLARLADSRMREQLLSLGSQVAAEAAEEVQRLQARLSEAAGDFAAGELSRVTLQEVSRTVQARIEAARERGRRADEVYLIAPLTTHSALADWWEAASIEERRRLVRLTLRSVIVNPATAVGSRNFEPSRVALDWI